MKTFFKLTSKFLKINLTFYQDCNYFFSRHFEIFNSLRPFELNLYNFGIMSIYFIDNIEDVERNLTIFLFSFFKFFFLSP